MNRIFQQTWHIPGTLAADVAIQFTAPCNLTLLHASLVSGNSAAAGVKVGTSADDDKFLALCSSGVSGTPVEKERPDFAGGQYPRIADGEVVAIAVDYDYNGGGAGSSSADLTIVLTFAEG